MNGNKTSRSKETKLARPAYKCNNLIPQLHAWNYCNILFKYKIITQVTQTTQ